MGRLLVTLIVTALLGASVWGRQGLAQPPAPRLIVIAAIDQLRSDYLINPATPWRGGFRRLLTEGAHFERAEYPYMNTVTCAGHATIGTGAFPRTHGMILNGWWDRAARESRACTEDPSEQPIRYSPAIEEPATDADDEPLHGESAKTLLSPTLADALRAERPDALVVSLSLKARSAIGLAGHAATAIAWAAPDFGFLSSTAFSKEQVPALAEFFARHPFQEDAARTWALRDPLSSYRYPDASIGARPQTLRTGLFPHRLAGDPEPLDAPFFTLWQVSPYSDAYLGRMTVAMIQAFRLGGRETTDFLGVSFSALDGVGHTFGPESREVEDHLRRLDDTLGELFEALDRHAGRGNWVLGLSSDHGVAPVAVTAGGGLIIVEDIRERIEETLLMRYGARADGPYVDAVVYNNVYLAPGVYDRLRSDPATYREVERAALGVPGLERLLRSDRLSADSTDETIRGAALSHHPERSGDIILVGKKYWYFSPRNNSAATTHGTGHDYDRQVPVILLGAGIKPGTYTEAATPADIAPTLAHLAGVRFGTAEGRVLREALR